jgi:hypothetical protein
MLAPLALPKIETPPFNYIPHTNVGSTAKESRVKLGIFETAKREAVRARVVVVRTHVGRSQVQLTSVSTTGTRRPVVAVIALITNRRSRIANTAAS